MRCLNDLAVRVTGVLYLGVVVGSTVYAERWPWLAATLSVITAVAFGAAIRRVGRKLRRAL